MEGSASCIMLRNCHHNTFRDTMNDLGSIHSLLGDIAGQLQTISRDCSCSSTGDLRIETFGHQSNRTI